jgi:hypothetical protein
MKLLVVIVNYRTAKLTTDALASIEDEVRAIGTCRVVVTDNRSDDESADVIQRFIDSRKQTRDETSWCRLMPLPINGGFAYGNNQAIRPALLGSDPPEYVLLLNPDTVARPGALRALLDHMDENPKIGIAGSRLENPDGTPQRSAFRFHGILSEFENAIRLGPVSRVLSRFVVAPPVPDSATIVDWVAGASMIVRSRVFQEIGLLDESFFMYFEEVDFCRRAKRAGWGCCYVPTSRVVHLVGQASGVTDKARAAKRRPQYWFDSRRRYFVKHHGRFRSVLADVAFIFGFSIWRLRRFIQRIPDRDPHRLLFDLIRNSALVKA